jgi:hypothetical protein
VAQSCEKSAGAFRVGVCWAGASDHAHDYLRSAKVDNFSPLFSIAGVEFISLQIGERASDADGLPLTRIDSSVTDFRDTARIMSGLDLIITVDTSTAHIAGALGLPTWLMLHKPAEFRWMQDRTDSPWYPSMTLYRQTKRGDWSNVVARIAADLRKMVSA